MKLKTNIKAGMQVLNTTSQGVRYPVTGGGSGTP